MKYFCKPSEFLFLSLLITVNGFGQNWLHTGTNSTEKKNFYELQKQFNEYFQNKNMQSNPFESPDDEGYYQFKRWEWFTENRLMPNGDYPPADILWNEYMKYKSLLRENFNTSSQSTTWKPIGPSVVPSNGGGAGRINCLTFMPGDPNTMFIGAACGGVWKTTDGGITWKALNTDLIASMSIADIVIDPSNTNIIYLATGDNYGIYSAYLTDGHYSAGVLKSTDGGLTWNQTGMIYSQGQLILVQKLIINPNNPSILLLASNTGGIFRTTDGGATWTNVRPGTFYSIEFNPLNPNTVFATDNAGIWRSYDNGVIWTQNNLGFSNNRVTVKLTPADTNYVYVWGPSTTGFKRSTNGGNTFTTMASPNSFTTPYGYYDRAIAVSPVNANEVYTGGLKTARTTNGGASWTQVSVYSPYTASNYCHADCKRLEFLPGTGTAIFSVNDGGIFKSINNGTNWIDLSNGLMIGQFYRIANAVTNPNIIYFGAQDNGSNRWDGTNWNNVYGADGMQPLVDYTNSNNVFICTQGGGLKKSTNGGVTFTNVSPAIGGPWVTAYVMDPNNPQIMYYGSNNGIYKSTNMGSNWSLSSTGATGSISALAVAKSNTTRVYATKTNVVYKSINSGANWTITGTLPVPANITYIAVSNTDPDKVWVTFSGYSAGNKVYMTIDGGTTWTSYSGTLPNIPINCIVYRDGSNDELYIGTDFGVFTRDASSSDWTSYNTGLPNVMIDHLEIQYGVNKLRAGTYGRGIWEVDFPGIIGTSDPVQQFYVKVYPNPSSGDVSIISNLAHEGKMKISIHNIVGQKIKEVPENIFVGIYETHVDLTELPNGVYFVKVETLEKTITQKITLIKSE